MATKKVTEKLDEIMNEETLAAEEEAPEINEPKAVAEPETVTIRIPRTRKDEEDVVVWVNNRRFLIKRGVAVEVPKPVAEILEEQERNLEFAYAFDSQVVSE